GQRTPDEQAHAHGRTYAGELLPGVRPVRAGAVAAGLSRGRGAAVKTTGTIDPSLGAVVPFGEAHLIRCGSTRAEVPRGYHPGSCDDIGQGGKRSSVYQDCG